MRKTKLVCKSINESSIVFFPQKGIVGSIGVLLLFVLFEVFIFIEMFVLT